MFDKIFIDETEKCPRCHSWDFTGGCATFDGPKVYQECKCDECGYVWVDYYSYSHSIAEELPEAVSESKEDEIKRRIVELSPWAKSVLFPKANDRDEITVLESFSKLGRLISAVVRVRGLGYGINFADGTYCRDDRYDEESTVEMEDLNEMRHSQVSKCFPHGLTMVYDVRDCEFCLKRENVEAWSADGETWVVYIDGTERATVVDATEGLSVLISKIQSCGQTAQNA